MGKKKIGENYFKGSVPLNINKFVVSRTEHATNLSAADYISGNMSEASTYQVIAHFVNEIKMGWIKNGKILFSGADGLEERYLLQIRAFNANEEIMLKKIRKGYNVRIIKDEPTDKEAAVKAVDSKSILFGERLQTISEDFVLLYEKGRKIRLIIPANELGKKYELTTRSYITYNDGGNNSEYVTAHQAGYGYYRYVGISAVKGAE